jgi:phosphoribosyl-ATP pyrophosphohydrolase/phosphoribosyl-AMP cyclohydrolase
LNDLDRLDWAKGGGLVPAIVQDSAGGAVLMLGYMNREALAATQSSGHVTFWSRSKSRLWTKGETSGNHLEVHSIAADCDGDTLLILARPQGPACHLGSRTCFGEAPPRAAAESLAFLGTLQEVIAERIANRAPDSYTARLLAEGPRRGAEIIGEAADLLYHVLVLLQSKQLSLVAVVAELETRHRGR